MKTIDDALAFADTFDKPANKYMSIVMLAAEVRRLREQVASDEITIELIDHRLDSFKDDNARLREENERLKSNPPQSLSPWQPIATAPSKTPIIVGPTKRMGICVAELDEHGYWYVDAPDGFHSLYTPTHWMPLPEPAP